MNELRTLTNRLNKLNFANWKYSSQCELSTTNNIQKKIDEFLQENDNVEISLIEETEHFLPQLKIYANSKDIIRQALLEIVCDNNKEDFNNQEFNYVNVEKDLTLPFEDYTNFSFKENITKVVVRTVVPYLVKKFGKELDNSSNKFEKYLVKAIANYIDKPKTHVHANFSNDREKLIKSINDLMKDIKQIKLQDLNIEELKLLESNLKDFLYTVV